MEHSIASLIQIILERAQLLTEKGDWEEALHATNAALEKAQDELSQDLESIDHFVKSLEQRGAIYIKLNQLEEAKDDIKQAIDQLDHRTDRLADIGRLYSLLGYIYSLQNKSEKMTEAWIFAVEFFEKNDPPLLIDAATICNNLGFSAKAAGNFDLSETFLLKSLEIMHSELGEKHEQTASISNNLGAVYYASKYYEQSLVMHSMALEARLSLFGENHPDSAQSRNNLALTLIKMGDIKSAREHFEKALETIENLKDSNPEEWETITSNYDDFLRSQGDPILADQVAKRIK